VLTKSIAENDQITLSYKNSLISFEFALLHYAASEGNSYAYMMEGLESKWNYVGNNRTAAFTLLPPGEYNLKVKAANNSGVWNEKGASLMIKVIPPYWQTLWFKIISGLSVLFIGFFIYKSRLRTIEKRKAHLENLNELLLLENKERRQAETEMKKAKEEAEKSDKLKSEFLAQISHEIRTPINAILSFASLLKDETSDKISDDLSQGFGIINRAGNRLIRTIDLILNMSQLQTNTYECNYKYFDIYEKVLKGLALQHKKIANDKNLDLFLSKEAKDTTIYADEYTATQIFENLINNAIKFTVKGKIEIFIQKEDDDKLVVKVYDTGVGISDEFLPNLFKPFTQEEGGYTRRFEGNGLGLALVKKYVELNNAKIYVESKKGTGTVFTVIFHCGKL
jgi:signal transduction histidine kinase